MFFEIALSVILLSVGIMLVATLNNIRKELRRIRRQQDSFFANYFEGHFWDD